MRLNPVAKVCVLAESASYPLLRARLLASYHSGDASPLMWSVFLRQQCVLCTHTLLPFVTQSPCGVSLVDFSVLMTKDQGFRVKL